MSAQHDKQTQLSRFWSGRLKGCLLALLLMAATVVATLPIIIVFALGQRLLVRGIAFTGLKG